MMEQERNRMAQRRFLVYGVNNNCATFRKKKLTKKNDSHTLMTNNSCILNLIYWEGLHLEIQYLYTAASDALTRTLEFD